jgi:hypothetical protein
MNITKLKLTEDGVHLEYEEPNAHGTIDSFTMDCADQPVPTMHKALAELAPFVIQLCELPPEYEGRIMVRGISAKYQEGGSVGAVIIARMRLDLSIGQLSLNTPYKIDEFTKGQGDERQLMPKGMYEAVNAVLQEGKRYYAGDRMQVRIDFNTGSETNADTAAA